MKATLTFDLPDDKHEHLCAVHGVDSVLALMEIRELLRSRLKYAELKDGAYEEIEKISEEFYQIVNNNGIAQILEM